MPTKKPKKKRLSTMVPMFHVFCLNITDKQQSASFLFLQHAVGFSEQNEAIFHKQYKGDKINKDQRVSLISFGDAPRKRITKNYAESVAETVYWIEKLENELKPDIEDNANDQGRRVAEAVKGVQVSSNKEVAV